MFPKLKYSLYDYLSRIAIVGFYALIMFYLSDKISNVFPRSEVIEEGIRLTVIYEWVIYMILFIPAIILLIGEIKESAQAYNNEAKVGSIVKTCFAGLCLAYLGSLVGGIISQALAGQGTTSENEAMIDMILAAKPGLLIIPVICVIGPIVEELVFRGALQKLFHMIKFPWWLGTIIASVLFGLIHVVDAGDYEQIFPYVFMGFALGYTYYKSKSIFSSILVHIAVNCISVGATYILMILEKVMPSNIEEVIKLLCH